jgi:hypothetical protein
MIFPVLAAPALWQSAPSVIYYAEEIGGSDPSHKPFTPCVEPRLAYVDLWICQGYVNLYSHEWDACPYPGGTWASKYWHVGSRLTKGSA